MDATLRQDGSAFAALSAAQQQAAVRRVHELARRARHDPVLFIETVARIEHGERAGQALRLAAHQRLLLRFVMHYPQCVVRMPVGSSKTFLMMFLGMWFLGRDRTSRGAIISAAAEQAYQPLSVIRKYIEDQKLALVYPELRRSPDPHDPWTKSQLVVERPGNIRTPSMRAIGIDGKLQGARISWALADDILSHENTATNEQRTKTFNDIEAQVITRLDPPEKGRVSRLVVTNTPWDRDDATYMLERQGYPSVSMSIEGDIWFANVPDVQSVFGDMLRPSAVKPDVWRLRAHGADVDERVPLWPAKYSREFIDAQKKITTPFNWARFWECQPFDESSARCMRAWVDGALAMGKGQAFPAERTGTAPTYTGVDIGGVEKGHDRSSICTIEVLDRDDDRKRRILNLQSGRWNGPELVSRIAAEVAKYDSTVYVESNGAQKFIADFAQLEDRNMRVVKFDTTGKNKYDETFGVEAVFTEMMRKQWIWPSGNGASPPELVELGNQCVSYNPSRHTGDDLMALFFARQGLARHRSKTARKGGTGQERLSMGTGGGF
jgi:hypothetical protein